MSILYIFKKDSAEINATNTENIINQIKSENLFEKEHLNQAVIKMFWDKTTNHAKAVDNNGAINNSFIVEQPIPVNNHVMVILLSIIVAVHIINLILKLYKFKTRQIKKKYANNASRV